MDRDELLNTLRRLHQELSESDSIDPQTRAAFDKVAADVERLTDPDQPTSEDEAAESKEGLNGLLREFEAEHPRLAEMIGRVADGLANLGI